MSMDRSIFTSKFRSTPGYIGSNVIEEKYNDFEYVTSRFNAFGAPKKSSSFAGI